MLVVEYMPAVAPPEPSHTFRHNDWISSLSVLHTSTGLKVLAGSYDNQGEVWWRWGKGVD